MKKLIVIPVIALLFAACGSSTPNEEAVEAAVSTMNEEEVDVLCEAMELYTPDGFLRTLIKAYDEGKPDGVIWIRVNHSPNKEDLKYMVSLVLPMCEG